MPCLCSHIDRGDYDEWVYILGFKGMAISGVDINGGGGSQRYVSIVI
jgi:hypothetical protein